ncbi:hypothetical protein D3C71_2214550 [compost metagenome]
MRDMHNRLQQFADDVGHAADGELSADQAAKAWAELAKLQKALKAAGFPRPKPEKRAQVAAKIEGQGELL